MPSLPPLDTVLQFRERSKIEDLRSARLRPFGGVAQVGGDPGTLGHCSARRPLA